VDATLLLAVASGLAIAAACGLRAFLPLLALGLAGRFGGLGLDDHVAWLAHTPTLWALGVATVVEVVGDKIPIVDHALDAVATLIRPLAGALAGYALLAHWPEPLPVTFALIAGTGALGVHVAKAKTRVGSTLLTAGAANPALSLAEDVGSFGLASLAILVPVVALILVIATVLVVRRLRRR
jgi:hypothetical protein